MQDEAQGSAPNDQGNGDDDSVATVGAVKRAVASTLTAAQKKAGEEFTANQRLAAQQAAQQRIKGIMEEECGKDEVIAADPDRTNMILDKTIKTLREDPATKSATQSADQFETHIRVATQKVIQAERTGWGAPPAPADAGARLDAMGDGGAGGQGARTATEPDMSQGDPKEDKLQYGLETPWGRSEAVIEDEMLSTGTKALEQLQGK